MYTCRNSYAMKVTFMHIYTDRNGYILFIDLDIDANTFYIYIKKLKSLIFLSKTNVLHENLPESFKKPIFQ